MNAEQYDNLTIILKRNEDLTWFVEVKEMPGCISEGDTIEDALEMIVDAMQWWLDEASAKMDESGKGR